MHRFASTALVPRPVPCQSRQEVQRRTAEYRSTGMSAECRSPEARHSERPFPKIQQLHSDVRVEPQSYSFDLQNCLRRRCLARGWRWNFLCSTPTVGPAPRVSKDRRREDDVERRLRKNSVSSRLILLVRLLCLVPAKGSAMTRVGITKVTVNALIR